MGFEIPLSDEAVRVFGRLNRRIADLLLEVQALRQENAKLKEQAKKKGKGRKVEQVKRWRKNNPDLVKEQKKRWRERKGAQKPEGQTKKTTKQKNKARSGN